MKRILNTPLLAFLGLLFMGSTLTGCFTECYDCNTPPPCTYGYDGVAGPAYFGLEWVQDQPGYVWTNNTAIPATFYYGDYYNSLPGSFSLVYEGQFMDGCCLAEYQWEVGFEVWINGGTAGGCGYTGVDGLPSYLLLSMGPYGPGEHRTNKQEDVNKAWDEISRTDDEIVLQHTDGDINVRATFKKLAESKKDQLDDSGIKTAGVR